MGDNSAKKRFLWPYAAAWVLMTAGFVWAAGRSGAALVAGASAVFAAIVLTASFDLLRRYTRAAQCARELAAGLPARVMRAGRTDLFQGLLSSLETVSTRLTEKARSADEERNRVLAVLSSMSEGVLVIAPGGRILLANDALLSALSTASEKAEGRSYWEAFRDAELNALLASALEKRSPAHKEMTPAFSSSTFELRISPVWSGREFLGIVAVFYDVTRLKQLERSRVDFVANVSHELKTPLTSILGFVETLKEGGIEDAANRMRFLDIIEAHSTKLHRLIEDLLSLSSVESGARELKLIEIDLGEAIERAKQTFAKPLKEKNVTLAADLSPAPFTLKADKRLFEEAFTNLLDNAVKYNQPDGQVKVKARRGAGRVEIEVADTGVGIPSEDLSRIFERFYRVDKGRSSETGGFGLGLAIAKHVVERHGGRITVESGERGTVFRVILPSA